MTKSIALSFNEQQKLVLTLVLVIVCCSPFISAPLAMLLGVLLSALGLLPKALNPSVLVKYGLQASIVFMGFGMQLKEALQTSKTGLSLTVLTVVGTITLGLLLGKLFKVQKMTALLITCGTAICGGSAIAAVSSVTAAKHKDTSFALGVVFVLNALALLLFPLLGHALGLSQQTFGYWAAIAIHDTSSVVGAGSAYGEEALRIATTVKLTRALWIIPLSLVLSFVHKGENKKIKIPWFIGLFIVAIVIRFLLPQAEMFYQGAAWMGKKGMVVALFFMGTTLSWKEMKQAGLRSFAMGVSLWLFISLATLALIV